MQLEGKCDMRIHLNYQQIKDNVSVTLPSSKSLSHRALIVAALANGDSFIKGITESKDTQATMSVLQHLGVVFERKENGILVHGCNGKLKYDGQVLDCNESGSTLRFMIPIVALLHEEVRFTGHGRLMDRPQSVYETLFKENGIRFEKIGSERIVQGPLHGGNYSVHGDVSSQFISGLLFALPLCKENSCLTILPPFESASYVGLTLDALHSTKVQCEMKDLQINITGNQTYTCADIRVEGDDSQMAFFAELALIQKKAVEVYNVNHASHQGDHVIIEIVKKMGGCVQEIDGGYRFSADAIHGTEISLADCPDLGPALFALATQCNGTTTFTHCERLRIKESDRIAAMEQELRKLGCDIHSDGGTVIVHGSTKMNNGVVLNGHNDHRIVMCLSVLATVAEDITIDGCEAVQKSYPGFFEDLKQMGVNYD